MLEDFLVNENGEKLTDEQIQKIKQFSQKKDIIASSTFETQTYNNKFINQMTDNFVALEIAKDEYAKLKNQKKIADKIGKVAKENTEAEIESASLKVKEKDKNNKVKKQEIKNELLKLKNERILLEKEQKHALEMQRAKHIREKFEDLLLRTCRKKQKDESGKWQFINDENGKPVVNIPSKFSFFWLRFFDGIISTLNQTAEIFGLLNKNVLKFGFILLILILIFVPTLRNWIFGLIGINL